jgi:uncharacterized protein (TIGR02996 family)
MTEEDALIRAILAAPDDATPRLIYADWLEERGGPRGEYLRCQCQRAALPPGHRRHAALRARQEELRRQYADVILPWQARLALGRVQTLLERMGRDGDPNEAERVKEWAEVYTPGPCLTERALARWEARNRVSLPEEYRLFLREVGNGGHVPGPYCDFEVRPLDPRLVDPALREAFPIPTGQLRKRLTRRRAPAQPANRGAFPELDEYASERPPPGCLWVGTYPSADAVFLVVTGEQRGTVWCRAGWWVPEHNPIGDQFDFLSWFESVLLEAREW